MSSLTKKKFSLGLWSQNIRQKLTFLKVFCMQFLKYLWHMRKSDDFWGSFWLERPREDFFLGQWWHWRYVNITSDVTLSTDTEIFVTRYVDQKIYADNHTGALFWLFCLYSSPPLLARVTCITRLQNKSNASWERKKESLQGLKKAFFNRQNPILAVEKSFFKPWRDSFSGS